MQNDSGKCSVILLHNNALQQKNAKTVWYKEEEIDETWIGSGKKVSIVEQVQFLCENLKQESFSKYHIKNCKYEETICKLVDYLLKYISNNKSSFIV